jgi:hypothetical protein
LVIVDTPPVMAVTDASLAANLAHGVLFVVGSEMTSRRIAQRAVEQLEMGQARFLGAVLNRVDLEHNAYYYSRYYRADYGSYDGPSSDATTREAHAISARRAVEAAASISGRAPTSYVTTSRWAALAAARLRLSENFRQGKHSS